MHLFTLKTDVVGPVIQNVQYGTLPTWVSGSPASMPINTTRNCVFDLGTDWARIDRLMIAVRADTTGMTGTAPSWRCFGTDTTSIPADQSGRLAQWGGTAVVSVSITLASNTSTASTAQPRGRYLIVTVDGVGSATAGFGASSAVEVTAFD